MLNLNVICFVRDNVLLCLNFRACTWSFLTLFSSLSLLLPLCGHVSPSSALPFSLFPPLFQCPHLYFIFLSILFPPLQFLFYFVFLPSYFKPNPSLVLSSIVPLHNIFFFSKIRLLVYHLFKRTCIFNGDQIPKGQKLRWKALFLNIQMC